MNRKILVAPNFPEGEIVNTFLARILTYSEHRSLSLACRRLLDRRPSLDGMPNCIERFCQEFGHLYGGVEHVIEKHTEYNFICCGLPKEKFLAQRERLLTPHRGPIRLNRLPLLFNVSENSYLQCPECKEEQEKEFGFAFVHRRMGAPFVNVCIIHGVPLHSTWGEPLLFDSQCQKHPNSYQISMTMKLGIKIAFCMENQVCDSKYHKDSVVNLMRVTGWLDDNNRIRMNEIVRRFSIFFYGAFSDCRLNLLCQTERYVINAIRALLNKGKGIHPEWCVLLSWFIEENPYEAHGEISASNSYKNNRKREVATKLIPSREEVVDKLSAHKNLSKTAKAMSMSLPVLIALCWRYKVNIKWRPKKMNEKISNQIADALASGMSPAEVASKFNISVSSVYRKCSALVDVLLPSKAKLLKRISDDKEEWLCAVRDNPGLPRTALKKKFYSLWMRLYRNDNEWLMSNQPPCMEITNGVRLSPPNEIIDCLNSALLAAVDVCTNPDSKRVNMSRYRLEKLTKVPPFALKKCEKAGAVEKLEENRDDFVRGRIARIGLFSGKVSTLAKKAGLREISVRRVMKNK